MILTFKQAKCYFQEIVDLLLFESSLATFAEIGEERPKD